MKQFILETAILLEEWQDILNLWPQANIKESTFPFYIHYIVEEITPQKRILMYLLGHKELNYQEEMDKIIPYLPFCLMIAEDLDEDFEQRLLQYQQRYETPLFLILPDDERLKERITQISRFKYKLPDFIVLEREQGAKQSIAKLFNQILEKLLVRKNNATQQPSQALSDS